MRSRPATSAPPPDIPSISFSALFTCDHHPDIVYIEEVMREGMQIEDAAIPVADKVALLDALSDTGLDQIAVGSFVSARYTPQMACIEELARKFTPRPGVTYLALALNARGAERAQVYAPPLTIERGSPRPRHGWRGARS